MAWVAGEQEHLPLLGEGREGPGGGGAAGGVHVGEGVVQQQEAVVVLQVELREGQAGGQGQRAEGALGEQARG